MHRVGRRRRKTNELMIFYPAEDGIRDLTVTGVQTCALPISRRRRQRPSTNRQGHCATAGACGSWKGTRARVCRGRYCRNAIPTDGAGNLGRLPAVAEVCYGAVRVVTVNAALVTADAPLAVALKV